MWTDISNQVENKAEQNKGWMPVLEFKVESAGPTDIPDDANERDIYKRLFPALFELGPRYTNLYARQKMRKNWTDLDDIEYEGFIAALLHFGRKNLSRADAWRNYPFGEPFIQSLFTFRRFTDILACFHFVDAEQVSVTERRKDLFWQVRCLIDNLNETFPKYYTPDQALSVDERGILCKHRLAAKQFNPSKPVKRHIKDFVLAEAKTGYVLSFFPYQGKLRTNPKEMSLAEYVIRRLLSERYWNKGYLLAYDNWFQCLGAAKFCLEKNINMCSTLRRGRTGFPGRAALQLPDKAERGILP